MAQPDLTGWVTPATMRTRGVGRALRLDLPARGDGVGVHSNGCEDAPPAVGLAGRERNAEAFPLSTELTEADEIEVLSEPIEANEHDSGTNLEVGGGWLPETV